MSRDQYSHMQQQFCGVNDYCDICGSIYPKIKIMAVWRQIHHSGHTPPRNHDLPHHCDFPDEQLTKNKRDQGEQTTTFNHNSEKNYKGREGESRKKKRNGENLG